MHYAEHADPIVLDSIQDEVSLDDETVNSHLEVWTLPAQPWIGTEGLESPIQCFAVRPALLAPPLLFSVDEEIFDIFLRLWREAKRESTGGHRLWAADPAS
jgi:hypothetical protein